MGTVHLARDPVIGRLVALKLLREGLDTPTLRARLGQEARAAGRLNHPNIVTIFHVDDDHGRPYIVMEYVEGLPLSALIRDRMPISLPVKLQMLERICAGLACAHDAGLVHRDIKPANIIIDADWQPKILDFGLAMLPDASLSLTHQHAVVGTLSYMSPEQLSNGTVDQRSDLFAVAALGYELVTYQRSFTGDTKQVISQILNGSPSTSIEELNIDAELAATITRGLNPNAHLRFQNARDMGRAFSLVRQRLAEELVGQSASAFVMVAPALGAPTNIDSNIDDERAKGHGPSRRAKAIAAVAIAAVVAITLFYVAGSRAVTPTADDSAGLAEIPVPQATMPTPAPSVSSFATPRPKAVDAAPEVGAGATVALPTSSVAPRVNSDVRPPEREEALATAAQPPSPLLSVGTVLMVRVTSTLDSRKSAPGDQFVGVLEEPLAREGRDVVSTGARVEGRVERSGLASTGRPFMDLSVTGVAIDQRVVPVRTGFYRAVAPTVERGPSFSAIVIGGATGAVIGGVVGGRTGAVAGAAIGAAGGAAVQDGTPTEYHLGGRLPFRLAEAVYDEASP